MKTQLSGGLALRPSSGQAPTKYYGRAKDARPSKWGTAGVSLANLWADFDPGLAVVELTSVGGQDIFVQKLDTLGNFIWARSFGGPNDDGSRPEAPPFWVYPTDLGLSINVDELENLVIVGTFTDSIDCDSGLGTFMLHSSDSTGYGVFVQKLDSDGDLIWAKRCASSGQGSASLVDDDSNIYITGWFYKPSDFDPSESEVLEITQVGLIGAPDVFVQKLNPNGELLWVKAIGANGQDMAQSMIMDIDGNLIIGGSFEGTVDFDPGVDTFLLEEFSTNSEEFVLKLTGDGEFVWVKGFAAKPLYSPLASDEQGNIYLARFYEFNMDVDPGPNEVLISGGGMFVLKLNAEGEFGWVQVIEGEVFPRDMAEVDSKVYIVGSFTGLVDFNPGPDIEQYGATIGSFLQSFDSSDNYLWSRVLETTGGSDEARGIAVSNNNIYCTGMRYNTAGNFIDLSPTSVPAQYVGNIYAFRWSMDILTDSYREMEMFSTRIFPNPTSGYFQVDMGLMPRNVDLSVQDLYGRQVLSQTVSTQTSNIAINVQPGLYLVELKSDNSLVTHPLIIHE
jgi:hypothetical protein